MAIPRLTRAFTPFWWTLVIPRTLEVGAIVLLLILGTALVAHAVQGEFAAPLLAYAAGVYFVMVHGPAPKGRAAAPKSARRGGRMRRLPLTLLLAVAACGERSTPAPAPPANAAAASAPDISKTSFAPALAVELSAMRQTPRGVWVRDLTIGTGAEAASGTQVAIHYVGTLPDGKRFDANGPDDPPFVFRLNAGEVVPGFDEGVLGMKAGGRRQVIIPPALGYGAQDNGPIPANSILVFTIDLVRVQ